MLRCSPCVVRFLLISVQFDNRCEHESEGEKKRRDGQHVHVKRYERRRIAKRTQEAIKTETAVRGEQKTRVRFTLQMESDEQNGNSGKRTPSFHVHLKVNWSDDLDCYEKKRCEWRPEQGAEEAGANTKKVHIRVILRPLALLPDWHDECT